MPSLEKLELKEQITSNGVEYRATLYTNDGHFIAWYRRSIRTSGGVETTDVSSQIKAIPQLNEVQLLAAKEWVQQQAA